ncbi:polysaccharide deacetylase family protein [Chelativorans alearense]|uniref:polysaccharide deacetylase family protein n=1 Tax=Chelativorans alearense TaxID=2681495 RepID=UPI0013D67E4C|nr:polysaccharide deacetylase family protein [Chelativorans alearense]
MPAPILLYHQIDIPPSRRTPFRSMVVHPHAFRNQMLWLKRLGYRGLSLREAMPYIRGERTGKVAAITFDDGFLNVFENALPVLRELGFTATGFFVVSQIGGSNEWDRVIGVPEARCMSAAQLREWAALGNEVGSHTLDHVHLPEQPADEARRQIVRSRGMLEDILGEEVLSFSYPYGQEGERCRRMVREAGYRYATTTRRGSAGPGDDVFGLPRATVRRNDTWLHFLKKCLAGYSSAPASMD